MIGVQVFDKDSSFDPRADPIVRVQARRLRARLVRYYREEGGADALVIELPKGGYTPVFKNRDAARLAAGGRSGRRWPARTPSRCCRSRTTARRTTSATSATAAAGDHPRLAKLEALRVLAVQPARPAPTDQRETTRSGGDAADRRRPQVRRSACASRCTWSTPRRRRTCGRNRSTRRSPTCFAAQEAVADAVVRKLEPRLLDAGQRRGARRPAENLAARNLYLQGRYHLNQRTDEGLQKALDFFEKAIVEDAQFALAHSGLADAHSLLAHYGVRAPALAWAKAASSAAAAVMLDGNSAEARTSLAHVKATQDWDWHGAEREFQMAIGLDPRYATAHHWYAMSCLVPMGRLDEALEEMRIAQSLDPVSSIVARDLALIHAYRRDFEAGARAVRPHHRAEPAFLARLLGARRDPGTAQGPRRSDRRLPARHRPVAAQPAHARGAGAHAGAVGQEARWRSASLRKVEAMAKQRYVSPIEFAAIRFALEQRGARVSLARQGVRGPGLRRPGAEGRSAVPNRSRTTRECRRSSGT